MLRVFFELPKLGGVLEDRSGFDQFAHFVETQVGIHLTQEKWNLVQTRLGKRLQTTQAHTFERYLKLIQENPIEMQFCIESLTTHKTEWFREMPHFRWLKRRLEEHLHNREPIQIWSAACSTGPEVYSIMFLCLKVGLDPSQFRILGTDLSERAIQEAVEIPEGEHFLYHWQKLKQSRPSDSQMDEKVTRALSESIKFRNFNLVSDELPAQLRFDVIFLRNVMIYFTRDRMRDVCRKLSRSLRENGRFILGLSESLNQMVPELVTEGSSIYRLKAQQQEGDSEPVQIRPQRLPKGRRKSVRSFKVSDFDLVAIGSSTGGTEVVKYLLQKLPKEFPPIVVVQHMPGDFTAAFATRLNQQTGRPTIEVQKPTLLKWGHAYIAAGGTQLEVKKRGTSLFVVPNDGPPVNRFKPSVSCLFGSMGNLMIASRSVAIILTGMGSDGTREMLRLRQMGAFTLGQSESSCAVYGMPRAAAELGALEVQASPNEMVAIFNPLLKSA